MANGFVVGLAPNTSVPPTSYWDGEEFIPEIDLAKFYLAINVARIEAGNLQTLNANEHVEAYSVVKEVSHDPPLTGSGI